MQNDLWTSPVNNNNYLLDKTLLLWRTYKQLSDIKDPAKYVNKC